MACRSRALFPAGVARFAQKYPAVLDALLRTMLEMICKYHKTGGWPGLYIFYVSRRVHVQLVICSKGRFRTCGVLVSDAHARDGYSFQPENPAVIGEVDVEERERDASGQVC